MVRLLTMDSSILALIILILIHINVYNQFEKAFTKYKLYVLLVRMNIIMIVIDILGWIFNGLPGVHNLIANASFNALLYIAAPIAPVIWIIYINYQIFQNEKRIKKVIKLLLLPLVLNTIGSILSIKTGWFFWVDINNIYHRGNYFWIHVIFNFILILISFLYIIINMKKIEKKYYNTMLIFFLPQIIGTALQILFYGVSFNWIGMMLSLLLIYFNIQNNSLNIDYLTGVYNRLHLDGFMDYKIQKSTDEKTFSVILIDLDNFKEINDNLGHSVGDDALKESVTLIKKCMGRNDFIARFGGDEFIIILDLDRKDELEETVNKLNDAVKEFNEKSNKQYKLGFCMGYDVYNFNLKMNADEFFRHIDFLMYKNKKAIKIQLNNEINQMSAV